MIISKQNLKLLTYIRLNPEINQETLKSIFLNAVTERLHQLKNDNLITEEFIQDPSLQIGYLMPTYTITHKGENFLTDYKDEKILKSKEKWQERLWGFISGVVLTVITWILSA